MSLATSARAAGCPNAAFRVGTAAHLPDCRAYEQITPADKDFGFGFAGLSVGISSAAGGSAAYNTAGPLPGSDSGSAQNFYLGTRSTTGWPVQPVTPPQTPTAGGSTYPYTQAFSADLSKEVVLTSNPPLTADATPDVGNLYVRDNSSGAYRLITTAPGSASFSPLLRFGGASSDFSHIVFETRDPLVPGAPAAGTVGVYESVDGQLRLVSVLPDGTPSSGYIGAGAEGGYRVAHAVSDDGSRIFFGTPNPTFGTSLYVRRGATDAVLVSGSRADTPDPNGPQESTFWFASRDGARAVFTSSSQLTNDANTGRDGGGNPTDAGKDLYEYDVDADRLTDLSVDADPADSATGANVQGVVGASDDGSYVYFVASGHLAPGGTSGMPNLYLRHAGVTTFIATLDTSDDRNWGVSVRDQLTSRVTPDGRHLLLQSVKSLTGYDNTDAVTGNPDGEVFLYDADADQLRCVSCAPSDVRPVGPSTTTPPTAATFVVNMPRNVVADGGRVFFNSPDSLVSRDTNGRQDVYEWERDGAGSCRSAGGCIHLISTGTSRFDASFADASANGDDVLFATREQLLAQDGDNLVDVYDARVGGGFAAPHAPGSCAVGNCQGQPGNEPAPTVPGSAFFAGPGNVAPTRGARFSIRAISKAAQSKLATTGRVALSVSVSEAGRLSAAVTTRIGRRTVTVAKRSASARKSGTVRLSLNLSRKARRELVRRHQLTLRISVSYSKVHGAKHATLTLHR
jgi:hypothetical protein